MKNDISLKCNFNEFYKGIILVIIGIILPSILKESSFGIYKFTIKTMHELESGILLQSAARLVILNSIRALPHYLGSLIISESIDWTYDKKKNYWLKSILSFCIILLVYNLIYTIYGIKYDFGMPAVIVVFCIILLERLNLFSVSLFNKILILSLFLLGVQWLDVVPFLSKFGFGGGEISQDIKRVAILLDYSELLTEFSIMLFIIFIFNAIILIKLVNEQYRLKVAMYNKDKTEKQLYNTRMKAIELRSFSEIQSLVHDLKSPLTTIQGLSSLSEMMVDNIKIQEYQRKISYSVDQMNNMISEILYEDRRSSIEIEKLFELILSHMSTNLSSKHIHYVNKCPNSKVSINKIRMARAVINTIENACNAIDKNIGQISILVYRQNGEVVIEIKDNGKGIKPDDISNIFISGYSGVNSTGLGLSFTKSVIDNHQGTISIDSVINEYTCLTIRLKEVE